MKGLTITGLLFAALAIDTAFLPGIGLRAVAPDVLLIVVLSLSLRLGYRQGAMAGLAGGVLCDLLTMTSLGVYALLYMLCGLSIGLIARARIQVDRVFVPAILAFALCLLKDFFLLFIAKAQGVYLDAATLITRAMLPSAAATAAVMALLYQPILKLCAVRYMRARRETDLRDF